jgi:DNA polymerase IV (DinB-like DNA polymerase)
MRQKKRRTIFHVDIDAFYASVETIRNPSLRGLPLVVGAEPKEGRRRGVVITCSYEAREFGVRSGMPISRAYKLCPSAVFLKPDFPLYSRVSSRVMDLLRKFADVLEQSGIDEAFLDVSSKVSDVSEARELAIKIKEELSRTEGLSCSIGIGPNKSSAKIASDMHKPDGLTVVPNDNVREFLAPLQVTAIPGVGRKTRDFLKEKDITTISELQSVGGKQLVKWFGKGGVWLWGVAQGLEELPVIPRDTPRSLSVERTFDIDTDDFSIIYDASQELCKELVRRVRLGGFHFKTVGVRIRFKGFQTHTRERTLPDYSQELGEMEREVRSLLSEFQNSSRFVRMIGVRVSDLKKDELSSKTLDSWVYSPSYFSLDPSDKKTEGYTQSQRGSK